MRKSYPELPKDFVSQIQNILNSEETSRFFEALGQEETTSIRLNPRKKVVSFEDTTPVPWEPNAFYLKDRPVFALDPAWHAGAYYVQESSSMLSGHVIKQVVKNNPVIALDTCAAPGGKTTHLADILPEGSLVVSNEIIPKRNRILKENIEKWGYTENIITQSPIKNFYFFEEVFDFVLVDAPCSGEGLFRKQPEAIHEWSVENVQKCTVRQEEILTDIHSCIKVGGYLCYSTCTFNVSENEEQVQKLLETGLYELIPISKENLPGVTDGFIPGTLRCWPHLVKGSGFFIALLKKVRHQPKKTTAIKTRIWNWKELKRVQESIKKFVQTNENIIFYQSGNFLRAFAKEHKDTLNILSQFIPITHFGINIGQLKKDLLVPAHGLIHSEISSPNVTVFNLADTDEALRYLRKADIARNPAISNGWAVVKWEGHRLGWVKQSSDRVNNYFPTELSLRI